MLKLLRVLPAALLVCAAASACADPTGSAQPSVPNPAVPVIPLPGALDEEHPSRHRLSIPGTAPAPGCLSIPGTGPSPKVISVPGTRP